MESSERVTVVVVAVVVVDDAWGRWKRQGERQTDQQRQQETENSAMIGS